MNEPFALEHPLPEAQGNAENEHFPTPLPLAAAIYQAVLDLHWVRSSLGPFCILEPGCGDGAPFLDAARVSPGCARCGVDIRDVADMGTGVKVFGNVDYLGTIPFPGPFDLVITNPPFSLAQEFVERSMQLVHPFGLVAMLLQTGIEASKKRIEFWEQHPFLVKFNIVPRPRFIEGGDMREYAAYVWPGPGLAASLRQLGRAWSEVRTLKWR